jgi:beta-catenin-like protein 1
MLKKLRLDEQANSRVPSEPDTQAAAVSAAKSRRATVEDELEDDMDALFAPGGDADYYVEEDEEGRFYGGGLTSEQKQILSIFERAEGEGDQDDVCSLRCRALCGPGH